MPWGAAAPWMIAGGSALANYFSNRGEDEDVAGYGQGGWGSDEGLHPELAIAKALSNVENLGAILQERAAQPISLPGAFVQPLPNYYGGGLPGVIGPQALDPALIRPGAHLTRPGIRFPEPELTHAGGDVFPTDYFGAGGRTFAQAAGSADELAAAKERYGTQPKEWLFPGGARRTQAHQVEGYDPNNPGTFTDLDYLSGGYRGAEQVRPAQPAVGGGFQELANALGYLGVEQDPFGYFVMGKNADIFKNQPGYTPPVFDDPSTAPTPRDELPPNAYANRMNALGADAASGIHTDPTPQAGYWDRAYGLGPSDAPTGEPGAHSEIGGTPAVSMGYGQPIGGKVKINPNPGLQIRRRHQAAGLSPYGSQSAAPATGAIHI